MDNLFIPKHMQELVDELSELTGQAPVVERLDPRKWRLTMANDRVRMWKDYKLSSGGRAVQAGTALYIDGEQVEHCEGPQHFARIFTSDDPLQTLRAGAHLDPVPATDPIEPVDPDTAPPMVHTAYHRLQQDLPDTAVVTVGQGNSSYWSVTAVLGDDGQNLIRVNFYAGRTVQLSKSTPIQLVAGGVDRTAEVEGRMDRALAMLLGQPGEQHAVAPPIRGAAPAARTNSVAVRKSTVIRV